MIAGVVFDFDGVLADTERLHYSAFHEVFASRGWELDQDTYVSQYLGHGDRTLIDEFSGTKGVTLTAADRERLFHAKSDAFRRRLAEGEALYPTARACVTRLAPLFRLGIASGALRAEIVDILTAAGLAGFFGAIASVEDVTRGKPAPDLYLVAAERLGVPPSACVAIEDSPWGLASARAAGMLTIGIPNTTGVEALRAADRVVRSLDEVTAEWLRAIGRDRATTP